MSILTCYAGMGKIFARSTFFLLAALLLGAVGGIAAPTGTLEHFTREMRYQGCASSLAPRSPERNVFALVRGGVDVPSHLEYGALQMVSAQDSSTSTRSRSGPPPDARQDSFMGTGNAGTGGFSTTYTDPQTGDSITRVVPPTDPNISQMPPVPIYIYPQVEPQWPPKDGHRPMPIPTQPRRPANPSLYQPYGN